MDQSQPTVSELVSGTALGHLLTFLSSNPVEGTTVIILGEGDAPVLASGVGSLGLSVISVDPKAKPGTPQDEFMTCEGLRDIRGLSSSRIILVNLRSPVSPELVVRNVGWRHRYGGQLEVFDYPGCGGGVLPFRDEVVCAMPLPDDTWLRLKRFSGTMSDYSAMSHGEIQ
jgi:hypothetical protein